MVQAFVAKCVYCPKSKETQSINCCNDCHYYRGNGLLVDREFICCSFGDK